jgi:predicted Rossmann fold flavoprotein
LAKLHKKNCSMQDGMQDSTEDGTQHSLPKAYVGDELFLDELLSGKQDSQCHYDLIIIGAGPSGLFCGINAMLAGKKILILEKKNSPGHKLLVSGSGQCNITHDGDIQDFLDHFGDQGQGRFLRPALLCFTNSDLISFFKSKGLEMIREKGGKVFPETRRARDVLNILMEQCRVKGVVVKCNQAVMSITRNEVAGNESDFLVSCKESSYRSRLLVIATGGCSYPATGSSGDGYRFAEILGHRISEIGPALTPLLIKDYTFSDLAGLSFPDMRISLYRHEKIREHQGDILFTHEGLSGPGILDSSRYIRAGDTLKLSFVPENKRKALEEWLLDKARQDGGKSILSALADLSHVELPIVPLYPRLIKRILEISGMPSDLQMAQLTRENRSCLVENLTGFPLVVSDLCGYNTAMVTRGGVERREIDPRTMQSRMVKGLYLVGEVLDVDGDTGGYNLQAAFSTGMLAARSIKSNWTRSDN